MSEQRDPQSFSAAALGDVIRELRLSLDLSQQALAERAGYGKGGEVSISRIERGLVRPGQQRIAGIALALGMTPEQLAVEARGRTANSAEGGRADESSRLRDRVADTKRRHAKVTERVSERAKITQEAAELFNDVHDVARDDFFMRFVSLAETVNGAPEPEVPNDAEVASSEPMPAEIRIESIRVGIASAIRGAAAGGAAGAAAGGAAAYGTFTAAALLGTASTGAAISGLSGVAATNAALAVLGGGTLAAGGAGMAGGALLLTGMVAAPAAALAAAGFIVLKNRRSKKEEERLRAQVAIAERALDQSQEGFDVMVDVLERGTEILKYVGLHGAHALTRWEKSLPTQERDWNMLEESDQAHYQDFLVVAGCVLAISSINVSGLLTAEPASLREIAAETEDTLRYSERTIANLV